MGFFKRKRKGGDEAGPVPAMRPSYDGSIEGVNGGVQCMGGGGGGGGKKIKKKEGGGGGGCVVM